MEEEAIYKENKSLTDDIMKRDISPGSRSHNRGGGVEVFNATHLELWEKFRGAQNPKLRDSSQANV